MAFDVTKIEEKIDKVVTGGIELSDAGFGIEIKRLVDAMEVAKLMAISGPAIPSFMRGNPGLCYAAVVRAVRWGIDPFFVAEHSYLVNNKGEEKVAYDAQIHIAVINARAPLKEMLRFEYLGEGEEMKCRVWATFKNETKEKSHISQPLGKLRPAKNEYGKTKGSPLWDRKPEVQIYYDTSRDWARMYCPHILAGIAFIDEFDPADVKDVTPEKPTLSQRLQKQKRIASPRGFDTDHVLRETTQVPDPAPAAPTTTESLAGSGEGAPSVSAVSDGAPDVSISSTVGS